MKTIALLVLNLLHINASTTSVDQNFQTQNINTQQLSLFNPDNIPESNKSINTFNIALLIPNDANFLNNFLQEFHTLLEIYKENSLHSSSDYVITPHYSDTEKNIKLEITFTEKCKSDEKTLEARTNNFFNIIGRFYISYLTAITITDREGTIHKMDHISLDGVILNITPDGIQLTINEQQYLMNEGLPRYRVIALQRDEFPPYTPFIKNLIRQGGCVIRSIGYGYTSVLAPKGNIFELKNVPSLEREKGMRK